MLVLSWNLFHGRAVPPAGRALLPEFAAALAGWAWDVALLQEVPPWWGEPLSAATDAQWRTALTSRNLGLPVRRLIAEHWPDLIKSNGGGANVILVRSGRIEAHRIAVLRTSPERRVVHAVQLESGWLANLHAQVHSEPQAQADAAAAARHVSSWAADAPVVLGGDFNTPSPRPGGFSDLGGHRVDRFLARGWVAAGAAQALDPARRLGDGRLSDHLPVAIDLHPEGSSP